MQRIIENVTTQIKKNNLKSRKIMNMKRFVANVTTQIKENQEKSTKIKKK